MASPKQNHQDRRHGPGISNSLAVRKLRTGHGPPSKAFSLADRGKLHFKMLSILGQTQLGGTTLTVHKCNDHAGRDQKCRDHRKAATLILHLLPADLLQFYCPLTDTVPLLLVGLSKVKSCLPPHVRELLHKIACPKSQCKQYMLFVHFASKYIYSIHNLYIIVYTYFTDVCIYIYISNMLFLDCFPTWRFTSISCSTQQTKQKPS